MVDQSEVVRVVFDLRGARTSGVTEERRERYSSVWHALVVRHLLMLKRQGRSTLASLDGRGGASDPVAIDAAIATVGVWLADCSELERYALALELLGGAMPVAHGNRTPSLRHRRYQSRCDVLAERFGGPYYAQKYHDLVDAGLRKVERRMEAAGVLG